MGEAFKNDEIGKMNPTRQKREVVGSFILPDYLFGSH